MAASGDGVAEHLASNAAASDQDAVKAVSKQLEGSVGLAEPQATATASQSSTSQDEVGNTNIGTAARVKKDKKLKTKPADKPAKAPQEPGEQS